MSWPDAAPPGAEPGDGGETVSGGGWRSWPDGPEASPPERDAAAGSPVVHVAAGVLGAPYRWGGAGPSAFDCSGLVYYAYRQIGRTDVPRTTAEQYRRARTVGRRELRPGDLVFFAIDRGVSHVGLYAGDGRFIHAPSPGRRVSWANLDDAYWSAHFAGAGRL